MTKRKTPFFFPFKGLSNSPIFQHLNFSFHRHFNDAVLMLITSNLHKQSEVSTKTRSPPASCPFKTTIKAHNNVKWSISNKSYQNLLS